MNDQANLNQYPLNYLIQEEVKQNHYVVLRPDTVTQASCPSEEHIVRKKAPMIS